MQSHFATTKWAASLTMRTCILINLRTIPSDWLHFGIYTCWWTTTELVTSGETHSPPSFVTLSTLMFVLKYSHQSCLWTGVLLISDPYGRRHADKNRWVPVTYRSSFSLLWYNTLNLIKKSKWIAHYIKKSRRKKLLPQGSMVIMFPKMVKFLHNLIGILEKKKI